MPDGPGGFAQDFTCPALLRVPLCRLGVRIRGYHPLRPRFPARSARLRRATPRPYNPGTASPQPQFGLFPVRSPLLGESFDYFLFLGVLRCFSSPGSPPPQTQGIRALQARGLSHSEIRGSKVICTYPRLIAAYRVLHRLREPRHPPDALTYFLPLIMKLILSAVIFEITLSLTKKSLLTVSCANMSKTAARKSAERVENNGFEPLTPCLQSRCSSQLS